MTQGDQQQGISHRLLSNNGVDAMTDGNDDSIGSSSSTGTRPVPVAVARGGYHQEQQQPLQQPFSASPFSPLFPQSTSSISSSNHSNSNTQKSLRKVKSGSTVTALSFAIHRNNSNSNASPSSNSITRRQTMDLSHYELARHRHSPTGQQPPPPVITETETEGTPLSASAQHHHMIASSPSTTTQPIQFYPSSSTSPHSRSRRRRLSSHTHIPQISVLGLLSKSHDHRRVSDPNNPFSQLSPTQPSPSQTSTSPFGIGIFHHPGILNHAHQSSHHSGHSQSHHNQHHYNHHHHNRPHSPFRIETELPPEVPADVPAARVAFGGYGTTPINQNPALVSPTLGASPSLAHEQAPLLGHAASTLTEESLSDLPRFSKLRVSDPWSWISLSVAAIPAVALGVILNLLDALSYGIIIFPNTSTRIPDSAPIAGVSMFLVSTIISQLVFALGGSAFPGANGSMMIEVMPFLYMMVQTIESYMGPEASDASVLATIMTAYAISTILTGLVFLLLGIFKLGNIIQFFPRHILVGCIGGIGVFLFVTGLEVTTGITPEWSLESFKELCLSPWTLFLWSSSFATALILKGIQTRIQSSLVVPLYYVIVPIIFYIVCIFGFGLSLSQMRDYRLLFLAPESSDTPFWTFWGYFNNFQGVDFGAIAATTGTQLALVFFAVLHVPINVPALAVSTHLNVDVNWEIVGHGISNLLGGFVGTPQSYLVYSNSLLFMRTGGDSHLAGVLLATATTGVLVLGGSVIGFIPRLVVGSLIFYLAYDLVKESVWDTLYSGISMWEYGTIVSIVVVMAVFGFTEGIVAGVVLACFFFVVMYSRRTIIRGISSGKDIQSTVHRSHRQRMFLEKAQEQIGVIKLQGFIFFGVVTQLESLVEHYLDFNSLIRYVVLDFGLVTGVDFSAIEALHRIKRRLTRKGTYLVFCEMGPLSHDLTRAGIISEDDIIEDVEHHHQTIVSPHLEILAEPRLVHCFDSLNEALEFCENNLLTYFYRFDIEKEGAESIGSITMMSPRLLSVRAAAERVCREMPNKPLHPISNAFAPQQYLIELFGSSVPAFFDPASADFLDLINVFVQLEVERGTVIWPEGSDAGELVIVETGELSQSYFSHGAATMFETLVSGTMVGGLEMFAARKRNFQLTATEHSNLWLLSRKSFDNFALRRPQTALALVRFCLSFDSSRFSNLVSHR